MENGALSDDRGRQWMGNAEGGTRTPTPFRVQRPERCVSTNFTTSAIWVCLLDVAYNIASQQGCQEGCRLFLQIRGFLAYAFLGAASPPTWFDNHAIMKTIHYAKRTARQANFALVCLAQRK